MQQETSILATVIGIYFVIALLYFMYLRVVKNKKVEESKRKSGLSSLIWPYSIYRQVKPKKVN